MPRRAHAGAPAISISGSPKMFSRISFKLALIIGLSLVGMLVMGPIALYNMRAQMMADRQAKTQHMVDVGYGILAQELIRVMRRAGVEFRRPDGSVRPDPVTVDFTRLIRRDTLITRPPQNLTSGLAIIGWADEALDIINRALPFRR